MANTDALADFKHGSDLLRDGYAADAIEYLRSAADAEKRNPYYLSFLGLAIARAHKNWSLAIELCETAVRWKPDEPQLHLNLAEVYIASKRRKQAIKLLDSAVTKVRADTRVKEKRQGLGKRRSRVLPFLSREHFLNRKIGQMRHKALDRRENTGEA